MYKAVPAHLLLLRLSFSTKPVVFLWIILVDVQLGVLLNFIDEASGPFDVVLSKSCWVFQDVARLLWAFYDVYCFRVSLK